MDAVPYFVAFELIKIKDSIFDYFAWRIDPHERPFGPRGNSISGCCGSLLVCCENHLAERLVVESFVYGQMLSKVPTEIQLMLIN